LAAHVVQRHGLLADEYRAIFGLMRRTGLVGAATKAAKRQAALPVLSQFWDSSPFKSASPEEWSVWFHRRGPRRLEDLADPDHRAIRQRNMAKATESLRGRTGPDAPYRKAKARQLELLQDPANSSRLTDVTGEAWLATGDAAVAYDPLSSQGILCALLTGLRAATAIREWLTDGSGAMQRYADYIEQVYAEYRHNQAAYYAMERRWPSSTFWRRRHGTAAWGSG
jgi:hypothetical protein